MRDFNYVSNTVDAFLELAKINDAKKGEVYNTGSGIGVTIGQVVNMLMDICGIAKPVEIDNHRKRPAKSEVLELIADSQKLIKASAWTSSVCLKTGLEKTVDWWTKPQRFKFRKWRHLQDLNIFRKQLNRPQNFQYPLAARSIQGS